MEPYNPPVVYLHLMILTVQIGREIKAVISKRPRQIKSIPISSMSHEPVTWASQFLSLPQNNLKERYLSISHSPQPTASYLSICFFMASISLPKHSIPLLPTPNFKTPSSQFLPILSNSSHSQIYGLKLSTISHSSPPPAACHPLKTLIVSKVY